MHFVTRKEWGARAPRGPHTRLPTARGVKVHYEGSTVPTGLLTDHTKCVTTVRQIQAFHMDANGWNDIAYNLLVCCHGYVFEGRGARILSAANGPGLNSGHYAVCALLGVKGLTSPTPEMLHGILDAIAYLRARGAGHEIKGHRDGYATSCPGPVLYAWIRKGCPAPAGGRDDTPTTPITKPLPKPGGVVAPKWPGRYLTYRPGRGLLTGNDVQQFQARMKALGYQLVPDGAYGPVSANVTKQFQRDRRLDVDGTVGPDTWAAAFK